MLDNKLKMIQNISSINSKIKYIKNNIDDKELLFALEYLLNEDKKIGITKLGIRKKVSVKPTERIEKLEDMIKYLLENNSGRDKDISELQYFLKDKNDTIKDLILKDLKLGITAKTMNKIIPNFIYKFEIMNLKDIDKVRDKFNKKAALQGFSLEIKENGVHGIILKKDGLISVRTRQGKDINNLELAKYFYYLDDGVYEGEFLAEGIFEDSNDQCAKTRSILATKEFKKGLYFVMFDYIPFDEFMHKEVKDVYFQRRDTLKKLLISASLKCKEVEKYIRISDCLYKGKDVQVIDSYLEMVTKNGKEGLVGKLLNSKYEFKRSENQVKIKSFKSIDLKILDVYEGEGKLKNTLGGLIVDYKGYKVGVGSGLSDCVRLEIWNNKEKYIGRIAEIKYKDETKDRYGNLSLQFPIFISIREEGKEVSYD